MEYSQAVKNARLTVVRDAIDAGAANGKIQIGTAGMASILAEVELSSVSGTVNAGVLTFSDMPKGVQALATGTPAEARFISGQGTPVVTELTVGLAGSGAHLIVDSTHITEGQQVVIASANIAHA